MSKVKNNVEQNVGMYAFFFKFCPTCDRRRELYKKGIRSGVTFSFYSNSLPLLFNFYDVLPYFYYASCFMIEYVMEDIEFRNISFSVYATTNRTKNIIYRNNIL